MKQKLLTIALLFFSLTAYATAWQELNWDDLLPESDLLAMQQLPAVNHDDPAVELPAVLKSRNVVTRLAGQAVRLPGFIVPVESDDDMMITEFFLVPYFGACIHVPPPPPNQIVYVKYPRGLKVDNLYDPFWINGKLSVENVSNEMAESSYSMLAEKIEVYEY